MALLRVSIGLLFMLLLSVCATAQDKTVDAAFEGASLNLLPYLLSVDTDKPVVTIKTAEDASGLLMELPAKGSEPLHRWVVVTLTNSRAEARDIVVATPHQGFAGSGASRMSLRRARRRLRPCGSSIRMPLRCASSPRARLLSPWS